VRALKYKPTPLEDKQKAILTQNLGFVVPNVAVGQFRGRGYFQDVLDGVLESAASRGYSLTIFVEKIWDDVGLAIRKSYDGRCDGLVMVAPQPGDEVVELLYARGTPLVTVGSTPWLPNISSVDIDNRLVGAMAAKYLFELGHRRLAFAANTGPQISSIERQEGFVAEAARLGLPTQDVTILETIPRAERDCDGPSIWQQLRDLPTLPTGILCWHDGLAQRVKQEFERQKVRIPEDISLIGVDDADEAQVENITTFKNPTYELGKRAAKVLIDRICEFSESTETIRYTPEMIVRASTGPPRGSN